MNNADPLTQGKHRDSFEKRFSQYLGVNFSFAVNNATSALEMVAQLCQFKEGDEVICPSHTFTSSLYPFLKKGARVKWADIDIPTRVVTAETIKEKISTKTKAIIVVHLYGYMADVESIRKLADDYSLILIEDNAQALGTEMNGKKAGSYGDFSVFSFHSHKNITTLGEGGMLVVKDPKFASIIPMLRHNGHKPFDFKQEHYWIPAMGDVDFPLLNGEFLWPNNYCIGEVECALGNKLLDRLDELNAFRRTRAIIFIDQLLEYPNIEFHREDSLRHCYHHLIAFFKNGRKNDFMKKMAYEKKIKCIVPYYPLNHNSLYKRIGFDKFDGINADHFFANMCSIPFQAWMNNDDFAYTLSSTIDVMKELSY
jgi:dTDP-4-amino-4,6-dideoxygalactose transaminase